MVDISGVIKQADMIGETPIQMKKRRARNNKRFKSVSGALEGKNVSTLKPQTHSPHRSRKRQAVSNTLDPQNNSSSHNENMKVEECGTSARRSDANDENRAGEEDEEDPRAGDPANFFNLRNNASARLKMQSYRNHLKATLKTLQQP